MTDEINIVVSTLEGLARGGRRRVEVRERRRRDILFRADLGQAGLVSVLVLVPVWRRSSRCGQICAGESPVGCRIVFAIVLILTAACSAENASVHRIYSWTIPFLIVKVQRRNDTS